MDKKLTKQWQTICSGIETLESNKKGMTTKESQTSAEVSKLQREFDRAGDNKEAALVAFGKEDIDQDELDAARKAFDLAADNLARAKELLPTYSGLKEEIEEDIYKLQMKRQDAEKEIWHSLYQDTANELRKYRDKMLFAHMALVCSDKVRVFNLSNSAMEVFGPELERPDFQANVQKTIEDWARMKV